MTEREKLSAAIKVARLQRAMEKIAQAGVEGITDVIPAKAGVNGRTPQISPLVMSSLLAQQGLKKEALAGKEFLTSLRSAAGKIFSRAPKVPTVGAAVKPPPIPSAGPKIVGDTATRVTKSSTNILKGPRVKAVTPDVGVPVVGDTATRFTKSPTRLPKAPKVKSVTPDMDVSGTVPSPVPLGKGAPAPTPLSQYPSQTAPKTVSVKTPEGASTTVAPPASAAAPASAEAAAGEAVKSKGLLRSLAGPAVLIGGGYGLYKGINAATNIAQQAAQQPYAYGGGSRQMAYGYGPEGQANY